MGKCARRVIHGSRSMIITKTVRRDQRRGEGIAVAKSATSEAVRLRKQIGALSNELRKHDALTHVVVSRSFRRERMLLFGRPF